MTVGKIFKFPKSEYNKAQKLRKNMKIQYGYLPELMKVKDPKGKTYYAIIKPKGLVKLRKL